MTTGTLFVVGTPLGNLGDLTARANALLREVPVVAAEDTRRTQRLLASIDAHPAKLVSYHAHSPDARLAALLEILEGGRDVALVSDAGTPGISDPGSALVSAAKKAGLTVVPIPGPSAVATALSASGLPADRYLFLGFLPRKGRERRERLAEIGESRWSVVVFEAANRLQSLLGDLTERLGAERPAVVARELTKIHEELRSGTLAELATHYGASPPKGEVTVVVGGRPFDEVTPAFDPAEVLASAVGWLAAGESRREVVRRVTAEYGIPRNEAYRLVMDLK